MSQRNLKKNLPKVPKLLEFSNFSKLTLFEIQLSNMVTLPSVEEIRTRFFDSAEMQLGAVQAARKILSKDKDPPIDCFVEARIISR